MTREEAIEELSILLNKYQDSHFGDAIDMAIAALEAKPCEYAISKSDVIDAIGSWMDSGENCLRGNAERYLIDRIKALPSVTPKQRTGCWVGVNPMVDTLMCSECGENIISEEFISNYCPNCGAKMVKPQETDDAKMSENPTGSETEE